MSTEIGLNRLYANRTHVFTIENAIQYELIETYIRYLLLQFSTDLVSRNLHEILIETFKKTLILKSYSRTCALRAQSSRHLSGRFPATGRY